MQQIFFGIIVGMLLSSVSIIVGILLSKRINQTVSKIERNIQPGQIVSLQSEQELVRNKFFKTNKNGNI